MIKLASIGLALSGLIAGIYAALLWHRASKVEIIPLWVELGYIEPVMPGQANEQWTVAIIKAANESSALNRKAAIWTAVAILLSTLGGLVGSL